MFPFALEYQLRKTNRQETHQEIPDIFGENIKIHILASQFLKNEKDESNQIFRE
jgi:hypothetical protein